MTIKPFNPDDEAIKECVRYILYNAPVQNLTEKEVLTTLRFMQLEILLRDTDKSKYSVTVYRDDERLRLLSDDERFLAVLVHAHYRDELLGYKHLQYYFGNTPYHWKKIVQQCPIIESASRTVPGQYGGRFYGKGWVLAKHIRTLRSWIISNTDDERFKQLVA